MLLNVVHLSARCFQGLNVAKVIHAKTYIQIQKYSRFVNRRPATIVNEEEIFEVKEAAYPPKKLAHLKKQIKDLHEFEDSYSSDSESEEGEITKSTRKRKREPNPEADSTPKTVFTKLYENEKLLSSLMVNIKSKSRRKKEDKIVLEGTRLINDAIQAGEIPEVIIFNNAGDLEKLQLPAVDIKKYKIPYRTIQLWSSLTSPPGIMGIFKTPNIENTEPSNSLPITIICDNVRDPGNMGSILRAAAGVGCDKVILCKGCVDLWEAKVLRSAAGAHFRLQIFPSKEWPEIRHLISVKSQVIVADNKCEEKETVSEGEAEGNEDKTNTEENIEKINSKMKLKIREKMDLYRDIPIVPYFSLDYTQGETVIIVGGETHGLSEETFKLITDTQGVRVNIPLNNEVESLNNGMALGIIAFEIKRQFLTAVEQN